LFPLIFLSNGISSAEEWILEGKDTTDGCEIARPAEIQLKLKSIGNNEFQLTLTVDDPEYDEENDE
jgi:hypothetical protein